MSTLEKFLETVKKGYNCLLTGGGGVGKTYFYNKMKEEFRHKRFASTATTGMAAMHINGQTIHSFSGMGAKHHKNELKRLMFSERWIKLCWAIQAVDYVAIDEVSMLAPDQVNLLDYIFRKATGNERYPFGAKQMIFIGDFLQIPPVIVGEDRIKRLNGKKWAFESWSWQNANIKVFNLTEVKRQKDEKTVFVLNEIRKGNCSSLAGAFLSKRQNVLLPEGPDPVRLYARNRDVDNWNDLKLSKIDEEEIEIKGVFSYHPEIEDRNERIQLYHKMKKSCSAPEELVLKKGCRVMILKNDPEGRYVNGSSGKFIKKAYVIDTTLIKNQEVEYQLDFYSLPWEFDRIKTTAGIEVEGWSTIVLTDEVAEAINNGKYKMLEKSNPREAIKIELDSGEYVWIFRTSFEMKSGRFHDDDGTPQIEVSFHQFPLRLAYAVTVHKSQGMTLDRCIFNFHKVDQPGMAYVGLSRVRDINGLVLEKFNPRCIIADEKALKFYEDLEKENK